LSGLFTRIIRGELPSYRIHEDEHTFSFLARDQIQLGHTLVVPKVEVDYFLDVEEPYYSAVFRTAKTLGPAIDAATGCKRVGAMIVGWDVPHFHLHLVPLFGNSDIGFAGARVREEAEMEEIQGKILAALG
jgi:histidine triad (HIT) family protein